MNQKINELLGEKKQLFIVRGQLLYPEQVQKQETGELYCTFTLKESKNFTEDEYGQAFNTYFCVIPAAVFGEIGSEKIKQMKGNEVTVSAEISNYIRRIKTANGQSITVNNVSYYVHGLELSKQLNTRASNQAKQAI
jgi:hypothetical protein